MSSDRYDGWIVTFKQFPVAVVEGGKEAAQSFMQGQARNSNTNLGLWGVIDTPVPIIKPYAKIKAVEGEINYMRLNSGFSANDLGG
jgi:hypothetical protein